MVSSSTLASKIVERGLDSMDFSMLTPSLKFEILSSVGDIFFKKGNVNDAIRAFVLAENNEKLLETGNWLLLQKKYESAARCFIPTKDKNSLEVVGLKCAQRGNFTLAVKVFEAIGDYQMVEFLRQNYFPQNP